MLKFVGNKDENPRRQLRLLLGIKSNTNSEVHADLDNLYRHILSSCSRLDRVHAVVGTILFAPDPLSSGELDELLQLEDGDVRLVLQSLQSVLLVPPNDDHPVRLFHPSFRDFCTLQQRAGRHYMDPPTHHARITRLCISVICNLRNGKSINRRPDCSQTRVLKYACRHWASHLSKASYDDPLLDSIAAFMSSFYHNWVEGLKQVDDLESMLPGLKDVYYWVSHIPNPPSGLIDLFAERFDELGVLFRARFQYLGDVLDIDRAVSSHEAAMDYFSNDVPPSYFHNFGSTLRFRFQRLGHVDDIKRSKEHHRTALQKTAIGHQDRSIYLTGLAVALRAAFHAFGDAQDINESITIIQSALNMTPNDHPNRAPFLNSLAISLLARFEATENLHDMDRAINAHRHAAEHCLRVVPTQPNAVVYLNNLGTVLMRRFEHYGNVADIQDAIVVFAQAVGSPSGAPSVHFDAAANHARCVNLSGWETTMDAYGAALSAANSVAWTALDIDQRQQAITRAASFTCEAAAAAIDHGHLRKAVEWVEQGCTITWSDGLHLRAPFSNISTRRYDLTVRLEELARVLEGHGNREPAVDTRDDQSTIERGTRRHEELYFQWARLMEEIRHETEDARFGLSRPISELEMAASQGPIIILNATQARCDALILTPPIKVERVINVELPISYHRLEDLARQASYLHTSARMEHRHSALLRRTERPDETAGRVIQNLWNSVAKPILDALELKLSKKPPRLWWCLTGPFTQLPLHAVTWDYAISSYIPSLRALTRCSARAPQEAKLLGVGVAAHKCPGIWRELKSIERNFPSHRLSILMDEDAKLENVQRELAACSGIHIATINQERDLSDPLENGFSLLDGLSYLMKFMPMAHFAYLSTCAPTDFGSWDSSRRASDMLAIRFRTIIATRGVVTDNDAGIIAEIFYAELSKLGDLDFSFSAEALHLSVQKLRDSGVALSRCIPFVHIGI